MHSRKRNHNHNHNRSRKFLALSQAYLCLHSELRPQSLQSPQQLDP